MRRRARDHNATDERQHKANSGRPPNHFADPPVHLAELADIVSHHQHAALRETRNAPLRRKPAWLSIGRAGVVLELDINHLPSRRSGRQHIEVAGQLLAVTVEQQVVELPPRLRAFRHRLVQSINPAAIGGRKLLKLCVELDLGLPAHMARSLVIEIGKQ